MAGTVKKLSFAEGVNVTPPTDLSIATSTTTIAPYATDSAYVTANGAAANGSAYINTTSDKFRYFAGSAWRNAVPESDASDATKTFLVDVSGNTTAISAKLAFAATANRTYTFPDASDTVMLLAAIQTATNKTFTAAKVTTSLDVSTAAAFALFSSLGANTLTVGGGTSTTSFPGAIGVTGAATLASLGGTVLDIGTPASFALFASLGAHTLTVGGSSSTLAVPGALSVTGAAGLTSLSGTALDSTAANFALFASLGAHTLTLAGSSSTVAVPGAMTVTGTLAVTGAASLSSLSSTALDSTAANFALFASLGAHTLTLGGSSSTVSIPGALSVTGAATFSSTATVTGALRSAASLILEDPGAGTHIFTQIAPTLASDWSFTWPTGVPSSAGYVLSSDASGVGSWVAPLTNPMTAVADIIVGGTSGAATRLALGGAKTHLRVNAAASGLEYSAVGLVPIGAVIPIASNITGHYAIPSTGTVSTEGWQYCDGAAIPSSQTLSGSTPNLTGSIFLMGSTSSGTTGGANSGNATSGGSATFNKNVMNSDGINHTHSSGSLVALVNVSTSGKSVDYYRTTTSSWTFTTGITVSTASSVTPVSDTTGAAIQGSTDVAVPTWNSVSVSTSFTNPTVSDNRPSYITVQYLIRVI